MPADTGSATACSGNIGYCLHHCPVIPMPQWKRAMDVVVASCGILILSPLFAALAICIKALSPGPVLFKQRRVGLGGKPFTCLKFRTMHHGSGSTQHQSLTKHLVHGHCAMTKLDLGHDPRIICGGRWIRQSGLDELPQLFNILLGHMSLVGPRPCIPYEFEQYCHCKRQRVCITPGLTGLWQVSGKNGTTYDEMVQLDLLYSRRISPLTDLTILFKTIPVVRAQVNELPLADHVE